LIASAKVSAPPAPRDDGPLGVQRFHRNTFFNYQLNRIYGEGFVPLEEVREAASQIRSAQDYVETFLRLADRVEAQGRLASAAFCVRAAEFFIDPTSAQRRAAYDRFADLFARAFESAPLERHAVPYGEGVLPAWRLAARTPVPTGRVVLFGGFDSLIEEFYAIWWHLADAGLEVVTFDGPGQGGARMVHGQVFDASCDHDWERPVGAVLDHFAWDDVTLIGISMGGYWAVRAAGREPRVSRVVAWPPVYDWLEPLPRFVRPLVHRMVAWRGFMRWSIRLRMRLVAALRHVVPQAMFIQGSRDPADVPAWFLGMNAEHLGSSRVTQDVLLLAGEDDSFQPPRLMRAQRDALDHARSVTCRVFTAAEHAQSHCQMGNLALASRYVAQWIADTPSREVTGP
jgi:pimeloyl-ACP methyl ester carboxylesterase